MGEMDQYKAVFLAESVEYIQQITDGLLALESDPVDLSPVEVVFRGAHSLKGMAAAMGYGRTADLTHSMEGLMDRVRRGERPADKPLIDLMLGAIDLVRDLIDDEAAGGTQCDPSALIDAIEAMRDGVSPAAVEADVAGSESVGHTLENGESGWTVTVTLDDSCVLKAVRAYMVVKRLSHMGRVLETIPSARDLEDEKFDRSFDVLLATAATPEAISEAAGHISEIVSATVAPLAAGTGTASQGVDTNADANGPAPSRTRGLPKLSETQTVRVAIGHLDALVDLVGELVILRSRLERITGQRDDLELIEAVDDLQRISTDLQYEVMQTRMVPVGNIFNRFPRMVRDLAIELGKEVDFRMEGLDIELDRTVLDEIGDPLVHLLRNSIDHGIETEAERVAAGKPPRGDIRLTASRERDHVAIIVGDDGKGIDIERIWRKAVERGLASDSERDEYGDADILLFTCLPGFSTAEKTTKVSGRGVGMDVVKGKIEHLGGTLQIHSEVGAGSDFVLRLPLTVAIVQTLLVRSHDQLYALPLSSVEEVYLAEELRVESVDGAPVVILRDGTIVPLHRLDAILFGRDADELPDPRSSVVLVESGERIHALHVDGLDGRKEIVVKPLSRLFRDTRGFSGATILGDGRVTLILDPRTIFTDSETVS